MSDDAAILIDDPKPYVRRITLNHPERRNAISHEMWHAIPGAVEELSSDDDVRVVVMRGAGDVAFVAGASWNAGCPTG